MSARTRHLRTREQPRKGQGKRKPSGGGLRLLPLGKSKSRLLSRSGLALGSGRHEMRIRLLMSVGAAAVIASALVVLKPAEVTGASATSAAGALKTHGGEPDLKEIWSAETRTQT